MELFTFDDEYVRRLREGDPRTEEHFRTYFTRHLLMTLSGRHPRHVIDDVTQEVFLRFYVKLHSPDGGIRDGRKLGSYVTTIARNYLFELFRQDKRTEPLPDEPLNLVHPGNVLDDLIDAEEQEQVRRAVANLPKKDREILVAIFFDEQDHDDVCREFGVDQGYLRVLIHRAKKRLRDGWSGKPRK